MKICWSKSNREHRATHLALAHEADPMGDGVPACVEAEFKTDLTCGILAHGFARARCPSCGSDFLVAFSCKGLSACPTYSGKGRRDSASAITTIRSPASSLSSGEASFRTLYGPFRT